MATVPLPHPLTSALDVVDVVFHLLDAEPHTTLAALVDRLPGPGQIVVTVDGGDPGPAGVAALDPWLRDLLVAAPGARFVLVSVRAGAVAAVAEADLAAWRALRRGNGVGRHHLLDWFVVTDDAFTSMADLGGPPPMWSSW